MAPKHFMNLLPFLLLLTLLSLSALSEAKEDPQLRECRRECSQSTRGQQQQEQCERRCWESHQQREREREREHERELAVNPKGDAERRYGECRRECEEERQRYGDQRQFQQCRQRCQEQYEQEQEKEREHQHGSGGRRDHANNNPRRSEEEEEEREIEKKNPYVFKREHFRQKLRTEHGNVRVLKNFLKRSKLLLGIANYRVAIVEMNPRTFLLPNHWDADDICYVVQGRGTVSVLKKDEKQSHQIRQGDILKIDAGSIVYVINSDSREKLIVAKLISPVSIPGKFEAFFGAGGENPESFYRAFSDEVLEAAFNTEREKIERVFGKQRRGPIVRASEEQIRAMTKHGGSEGSHIWPFGGEGGRTGESKGTYNLLNKRPAFSNQYGQLYEADSDDWRQLGDLDVRVSFANITSGSMLAPSYNSRSTKIAVVVEGQGEVEIICPHLGKEYSGRSSRRERYEEEEGEEEQQQGQQYQRIRSDLSRGTVFVVPAGHPTVAIASRNGNLQIMCFEIRAEKNERFFLAGRNNVLRKMEREAKELAFDTPAREVDELFNSQREEAFLPGPESRRRGGRSRHGRGDGVFIEAILEAAVGM